MVFSRLGFACTVLLCAAFIQTARGTKCRASDSAALLELKEGLSCQEINPNYICPFDSWLPGTDCCVGWQGISCDASGQVTGWRLQGYWNSYLTFQIGRRDSSDKFLTQLSRVTALESIDISFVNFGGAAIPKEWGQLSKLKNFNIEAVKGFGQGGIPKEFGNLKNLQRFYWNTLVPDLLGPGLSSNTGVPKELCKLHNLREFTVFLLPEWSGTLPSCIDGWKSIQTISIKNGDSGNFGGVLKTGGLTGSLPSNLGKLKNLTELSLVGNKFTGSIPTSLGNLSNLITLRLSYNRLHGKVPWSELSKLKSLEWLDLSTNGFYGPLPQPFFPNAFQDLQQLEIDNNNFWGEIPRRLIDLPKINTLRLQHNRFWGLIPSAGPNNVGSPMYYWDVSFNYLSGTLPKLPPSLNYFLAANNSNIQGSIPASYGFLFTLNLANNRLTGSVPDSVKQVQVLDLTGNNFSNYP
ncbi:hypothetical protein MPTK1_8g00840 [Marchantia polymorpha subsp. ruderalis]|nr:hypothetical protein MARPO_0064s0113 [Marchantia polymorpha]PTQ36441.1 hypothetical protein MARPO_0064s0113 [Marchantia polymorpha]BBN18232.1 hypothetical protein Mp_8g00840 [Marchantia polymorpha subsp. ruderalis]BBN18233.1 hypothetical protein Mp_8g00840 [Marchantia polymorpha subsp. ruderalis]|eukprot:PTQ36440.1 hypothetical protein MARPO_0064s0113 [Marchantia polymorpha]